MNDLALPDIAAQLSHHDLPLDWVGMAGITLPVRLVGQPLTASVDIGVSLDEAQARGIHMSRLYLALQRIAGEELTVSQLRGVLDECLQTHQGLSLRASLTLRGEVALQRQALISPLSGWKAYPFELRAQQDEHGFHVELQLSLAYSSTCPCSAALARQLIKEKFSRDFAGKNLDHAAITEWLSSSEGILATPHSQRSSATLQLCLNADTEQLPLLTVLDAAEQALGTPVQTAVKRADEQAFALANGQNLMFCEDAVRSLHRAMLSQPEAYAFHIRVVHAESLHAHDAVAESSHNW